MMSVNGVVNSDPNVSNGGGKSILCLNILHDYCKILLRF